MKDQRRLYEDLVIGQVEQSGTVTVDRAHMLDFAREYDPQYFHVDEEAAKSSRFGDVIASGQYTMMLWRKLDHQISHDIAWICGVGWDDVRWPVAVYAGDTLQARAWCISKRESSKDPSRGVVRFQYELTNQRDEVVFTSVSTNLIERRAAPDDPPGA